MTQSRNRVTEVEQHCVSVDNVEALSRRIGRPTGQVVGVAHDELDIADLASFGKLAGLANHVGLAVHLYDPSGRHTLRKINGDGARTAAHIQHIHARSKMTE